MKKQEKNRVFALINAEIHRQSSVINLIPSENYTSFNVLRALGSPLTNKYSEGYPGKRYYSGNIYCDEIEKYSQELALKVFGLSERMWSVNIQPYSGSPANLAVYLALVKPGEKILGLSLFAGGHLSHGHFASFTGKLFRAKQYEINRKTERIDYKALEKITRSFKPKIIVSGTTSYPRKINFAEIDRIAKSVGAYHLADISHIAGLVAAKLHQSPFSYADVVTTTTHKTLRGPRGALIFSRKSAPRFPNKPKSRNTKSETLISDLIDRAVFPGLQGGPHNHQTAAIAVALEEALRPTFIKYQTQIVKNAKKLAEELQNCGFKLYTNGTDNHLLLIDLKSISPRQSVFDSLSGFALPNGKEAEKILEEANITANRNFLPGDNYNNPTGLRLGTPAITTRGMKEKEMIKIANWIKELLINKKTPAIIKKEILKLLEKFPLQ